MPVIFRIWMTPRLLPILLICCVNCLNYPRASTLVQGAFMLDWILTQAFKVPPNKRLLPNTSVSAASGFGFLVKVAPHVSICAMKMKVATHDVWILSTTWVVQVGYLRGWPRLGQARDLAVFELTSLSKARLRQGTEPGKRLIVNCRMSISLMLGQSVLHLKTEVVFASQAL